MAAPVGSNTLASHSVFDIGLGAAMIILALAFYAYLTLMTGTGRLANYDIMVEMANAGTLKLGTDVRVGGVKVGKVTGLSLDKANYRAQVQLQIRDDLHLPEDSAFALGAQTMGDVYLSVSPGRSSRFIPPGGRLLLSRAPAPRAKR